MKQVVLPADYSLGVPLGNSGVVHPMERHTVAVDCGRSADIHLGFGMVAADNLLPPSVCSCCYCCIVP